MKPGDTVRIVTATSEHIGLLMPNEETDAIVIKLESGYNIGIAENRIIRREVIKSAPARVREKKTTLKINSRLPTVAVLHTGGTIASKVDYESGAVSAKFSAKDLINMVPELKKIVNIKTELVANMMSEDMHFSDHQKIAKCAKKYIDLGVDGIIIGHGTDTLGYTAAGLSFMFDGLSVPILIVGSQRSSDRGSSDAALNLIAAAHFIAKTDYAGVATCLHHTTDDGKCAIISGTKSRKLHTSRRDAFRAVNTVPIALVDASGKIEYLGEHPKKGKTRLRPKMERNVALLKTHPNMSSKVFETFTRIFKGIVIEGTGLGHAPTNLGEENLKNYSILEKYIRKGGIVCMTSQCIYGRVNPNVYTNLRRLKKIGVVFCEDMLPETALMKLAWVLGNFPSRAVEMMTENIRGEITKRSLPGK